MIVNYYPVVSGVREVLLGGILNATALENDINKVDEANGRNSIMVCGLGSSVSLKTLDTLCVEITEQLWKAGGNISHVDKLGWTALAMASTRGLMRTCSFLMSKGADVNSLDHSDRSPLILAAAHGFENVFSVLLAGGANISHADANGMTPLHYIVATMNSTANEPLSVNGNDTVVSQQDEEVAVETADLDHSQHANPVNIPMLSSVRSNLFLRALQAANSSKEHTVDFSDQHQRTPLMYYVMNLRDFENANKFPTTEVFRGIENGTDILNRVRADGSAGLTCGAVIDSLIIFGADPKREDKFNVSPWQILFQSDFSPKDRLAPSASPGCKVFLAEKEAEAIQRKHTEWLASNRKARKGKKKEKKLDTP